jgi:hypothetical protein
MKRDENQHVEYKVSWHDKYLEWICGYAIEFLLKEVIHYDRPRHTLL